MVCTLDQVDPFQVVAPALLSTATQKDDDAHDTASNGLVSTPLAVVHDDPPYVKALPSSPTAAQKLGVGHDTETRLVTVSTATGADHDDPS